MPRVGFCVGFCMVLLLGACAVAEEQLPTMVPTAAPLGARTLEAQELVPATFTPVATILAPTLIPQDTYTPLPTYTPYPTFTPYPTTVHTEPGSVLILPSLTPIVRFSGTEAEFRAYLRAKYSSIAGQSLTIEQVSIFNEGGTYPNRSVSIELSSESANRVFGAQLPEAALDYGRNLMNDTEAFFGGKDFMVRVFEVFYDDYLSDRYFDDDWYYIGSYYVGDGWAIQKDYVIGHYRSGNQSLDVWNR